MKLFNHTHIFTSHKSDQGNTVTEMFVGGTSYYWMVDPLKAKNRKRDALKNYSREMGAQTSLKRTVLDQKWTLSGPSNVEIFS